MFYTFRQHSWWETVIHYINHIKHSSGQFHFCFWTVGENRHTWSHKLYKKLRVYPRLFAVRGQNVHMGDLQNILCTYCVCMFHRNCEDSSAIYLSPLWTTQKSFKWKIFMWRWGEHGGASVAALTLKYYLLIKGHGIKKPSQSNVAM